MNIKYFLYPFTKDAYVGMPRFMKTVIIIGFPVMYIIWCLEYKKNMRQI
jgi:hypothetical protein